MSLVKNLCKDMIEQYKKDKMNNVKFDGPLSPILTTMIPLKVNILYNNNSKINKFTTNYFVCGGCNMILVSLALIVTSLQDYNLTYI